MSSKFEIETSIKKIMTNNFRLIEITTRTTYGEFCIKLLSFDVLKKKIYQHSTKKPLKNCTCL